MAIPKIELIYSYSLNILFFERFSYSDIRRLKKSCVDFGSICTGNISRDLALIQNLTGFRWTKSHIPVYVVRCCPNSISSPLILRYQEDAVFMYVLLLHELVHINLKGNIDFMPYNQLEVCIDAVVRAVLERSSQGQNMPGAASKERNWRNMMESGIVITEKTPLKAIIKEGPKGATESG